MIKLVAETAWHHEGDQNFLKRLVEKICQETDAEIIKLHITLDLDEYMSPKHDLYGTLKKWMISEACWKEVVDIIRDNNKELLLLLNDSKAIAFAKKIDPEYVEIHSMALNVPRFHQGLVDNFDSSTGVFIGVGGCSVEEIDHAIHALYKFDPILMFGFQNYPTKYQSINLAKIQKIQRLYPKARYGYADHCGWDEQYNEMVTLMVASNNMQFVEKHVTLQPGIERCDYSAAISINQFKNLSEKIKILEKIISDGRVSLNTGESNYSIYGPMKMAPISIVNAEPGETLKLQDVDFKRVEEISDLSQLAIHELIEHPLKSSIKKGQVLHRKNFI